MAAPKPITLTTHGDFASDTKFEDVRAQVEKEVKENKGERPKKSVIVNLGQMFKVVMDVSGYGVKDLTVTWADKKVTIAGETEMKTFKKSFSAPSDAKMEETRGALSHDGWAVFAVPREGSANLITKSTIKSKTTTITVQSKGELSKDSFFSSVKTIYEKAVKKTQSKYTDTQSITDEQTLIKTLREKNVADKNQIEAIEEDEDNHNVLLDVSGYSKDDLEITYSKETRTIQVEGSEKSKMSSKSFTKMFIINENFNLDEVESGLSSDGVLAIKVPKTEEYRKKTVTTTTSSTTNTKKTTLTNTTTGKVMSEDTIDETYEDAPDTNTTDTTTTTTKTTGQTTKITQRTVIVSEKTIIKIVINVTGYTKRDVTIKVTGTNEVTVTGQTVVTVDGRKVIKKFIKTFAVPEDLDLSKATVEVVEDVLVVVMPKKNAPMDSEEKLQPAPTAEPADDTTSTPPAPSAPSVPAPAPASASVPAPVPASVPETTPTSAPAPAPAPAPASAPAPTQAPKQPSEPAPTQAQPQPLPPMEPLPKQPLANQPPQDNAQQPCNSEVQESSEDSVTTKTTTKTVVQQSTVQIVQDDSDGAPQPESEISKPLEVCPGAPSPSQPTVPASAPVSTPAPVQSPSTIQTESQNTMNETENIVQQTTGNVITTKKTIVQESTVNIVQEGDDQLGSAPEPTTQPSSPLQPSPASESKIVPKPLAQVDENLDKKEIIESQVQQGDNTVQESNQNIVHTTKTVIQKNTVKTVEEESEDSGMPQSQVPIQPQLSSASQPQTKENEQHEVDQTVTKSQVHNSSHNTQSTVQESTENVTKKTIIQESIVNITQGGEQIESTTTGTGEIQKIMEEIQKISDQNQLVQQPKVSSVVPSDQKTTTTQEQQDFETDSEHVTITKTTTRTVTTTNTNTNTGGVSLVPKGDFYQDTFFEDSRSIFEKALKNTMTQFNDTKAIQDEKTLINTLREKNYQTEKNPDGAGEDSKFKKIVIDVKGYRKDNLNVSILDETYTIKVSGKQEDNAGGVFSSKSFNKTFILNETYNLKEVTTGLSSDGVLTLKVPRLSLPGYV